MNDNKHSVDCGCSRCLECIIGRQKAEISTLQEKNTRLREKIGQGKNLLARCAKEITEQDEKLRWIPVSERLPEVGQLIMSIHTEKKLRRRLFIHSGLESDIRSLKEFHTHWREIDLPKGEQEQHNGKE